VTIESKRRDGFRSGYRIELPPASIMALQWQRAGE
jgi:hypothetical protein